MEYDEYLILKRMYCMRNSSPCHTKENMKSATKWLFFVLIIFLAACSAGNEQAKSPAAETQECIGDVEDFIYQLPTGLFYNIPDDIEGVLPKPSWEFVLEIPADSMDSYAYIETTREKDGKQEIWILTDAHYIVYQPELDEHFVVSKHPQNTSDIEQSALKVEQLVLAKDSRLWGRNTIDGSLNGLRQAPLFSFYNEEKKQFELIDSEFQFKADLLQDWISCASYHERGLLVVNDFNDHFWVFHPTDGLFIFDPVAQTINEFHELDNLRLCNAAITPDGTALLQKVEKWSSWRLDEGEILKFDPNTKTLETVDRPFLPWPDYGKMVASNDGSIYLGIHGYYTTNGNWHLMNPHPVAYIDLGKSSVTFNWQQPDLMSQSSNGYLWFSNIVHDSLGQSGTAWLDPETGEGCWFTSYGGKVVEDSQGTYWIVVDGKLYKNSELN